MEEVLVLAIRLLEDNRLLTLQADLSQPILTHKQILTVRHVAFQMNWPLLSRLSHWDSIGMTTFKL